MNANVCTTSDLGGVVLEVILHVIISNRSDQEGVEVKPNMKGIIEIKTTDGPINHLLL